MEYSINRFLPSVVSIVLFIFNFVGLTINLLISHKIATNDLQHLSAKVDKIETKLDSCSQNLVKIDERLSILEGYIKGKLEK